MARSIGIDTGSSVTRISARGKGIVFAEPTVVILNEAEEEMVAVGKEAAEMVGKTPDELSVCYPIHSGAIVHCDEACAMLSEFIGRAIGSAAGKLRVLAGVPSGITEIERLALEEVIGDAGATEVLLLDNALLAAVGAERRVTQPRGTMVIDVGAGTTEVAVMSMGTIVAAESLKIAGDQFDLDLEAYLRRKFGLIVDAEMAEGLKIAIGAVHPEIDRGEYEFCGRNSSTGLPLQATLRTPDILPCLTETASAIAECARRVLEKIPPEMAADILEDGIALTGGGAQLGGLDLYLSEMTKAPVTVAQDPANCTAHGLSRLLEYRGELRNLFRFQN